MGLLSDIQASLLNNQPLGPILLKFRFLANRLGSEAFEDWVKYEAEGYPKDAVVPEFRKFPVTYTGSFNGSFGRVVTNTSIPPALIAEHAGEQWLTHEERQSCSAIEDLIKESEKSGTNPVIDASNLILVLSNKVFSGMACHSIRGIVSRASMVQMIGALRARALELTLEIEKSVPGAVEIAAGQHLPPAEPERAAAVTHITNQTIYGSVGANVANNGAGAQFKIAVRQGDLSSLVRTLEDGGIPTADAKEFASIVASERSERPDDPLGSNAKDWLLKNIKKALDGTWKIGAPVATALLAEAVKKYYGIS